LTIYLHPLVDLELETWNHVASLVRKEDLQNLETTDGWEEEHTNALSQILT